MSDEINPLGMVNVKLGKRKRELDDLASKASTTSTQLARVFIHEGIDRTKKRKPSTR